MSFTRYNPSAKNLSLKSRKYHVFLSFRGKDVRKSFVDHLYNALITAGINTFLDSEKLKKGKSIGLSLEQAIDDSDIRIPIFSRDYAHSSWCLREVTRMWKSQGLTIPLFYDVEPADVRYPEQGLFAEAFQKHLQKGRHSEETIDEWKNALSFVSSLSGWSLNDTSGYEAKLVKLVVSNILSTLNHMPLRLAKFIVGLEDRTNEVMDLLKVGSDTSMRTVCIWGMGGIGKTTLAKAVYNNIYLKFDAACFVSDIRFRAEQINGLRELQMQMVQDLLKIPVQVSSVDQGSNLMEDHLRNIRALVILDDVDHRSQLDALKGDWFGPGSRVIITTRDQGVSNNAAQGSEFYLMEGLKYDQALELFCWHAFMLGSPDPGFENLTENVVKACDGLPLSLEVVGAFLSDKRDTIIWQEALTQLESAMYGDIHGRLRISYTALTPQEKEIFLDIACFFIGEHREVAVSFWEANNFTPNIAITSLILKSLIKLNDNDQFLMHDHLQEMAKAIVLEESNDPAKRSRLWRRNDIQQVIENGEGTGKVRGLLYQEAEGEEEKVICQTKCFASMHDLKFLSLNRAIIQGNFEILLPPNLQWLSWKSCPFLYFPSDWKMKRLAVLRLENNFELKELWHGISHSKIPQALRVLQLNGCQRLQRLPEFSKLSVLIRLELSHCWSLKTIPESIGLLRKLRHLDLTDCISLEKLPHSITNLSSLENLILSGCTRFKLLPTAVGGLSALKELRVDATFINELPSSIGSLSYLQKLSLNDSALESLPTSICHLKQLLYLDMSRCYYVSHLPEEFGNLIRLEELLLNECSALFKLPQSFGQLESLRVLEMNHNHDLTQLPASFSQLKSLQTLKASGCNLVQDALPNDIGQLSLLEVLHLDFNNFRTLPISFAEFPQLSKLFLHHCKELQALPTLPNSLVEMDIGDCERLQTISDISNLIKLEVLVLCNCEQVADLPGLKCLHSLTELNISRCKNLTIPTVLTDLQDLRSLKKLYLTGCNVSPPHLYGRMMKELPFLQELSLSANKVPPRFRHKMQRVMVQAAHYEKILCMRAIVQLEDNANCRGVRLFVVVKYDKLLNVHNSHSWYFNEHPLCIPCIEISIVRCGHEIYRTSMCSNRHANFDYQFYLCVYGENHPLVMRMQNGDLIQVWASTRQTPEEKLLVRDVDLQFLYHSKGLTVDGSCGEDNIGELDIMSSQAQSFSSEYVESGFSGEIEKYEPIAAFRTNSRHGHRLSKWKSVWKRLTRCYSAST